jgi:hypothetical protein
MFHRIAHSCDSNLKYDTEIVIIKYLSIETTNSAILYIKSFINIEIDEQNGTKWHKMAQNGTKWYKVVQNGTKWYTKHEHMFQIKFFLLVRKKLRKFNYYVFYSSNTIRKTEIRYSLVEKNNAVKKVCKRYMTKRFILYMPGEEKNKKIQLIYKYNKIPL